MKSRTFYFSAALSVICGVIVFLVFKFFTAPGSWSGDPCAVLVISESWDDRYIRESLADGGIDGIISESSQEIPMDDFGSLRMVPLDSFRNEIEEFDPRDNGYAARLRAFFVRDGQRLFFIPLKDHFAGRAAKLEEQAASVLGDIPFTFGILGQKRSSFWYFALLAAACIAAWYFSRSRRLFIFGLPVLLAFGWVGSRAFILAAIFSGIWELLREPLRELLRPGKTLPVYTRSGFRALRERLRLYRLNLFLVFIFFVFFVVYSISGGLPFIPLAAGFGAFFFLCFLSLKAEAERARNNKHILFTPLPLLPLKMRTFSFFPFLLPFGAGAALALLISVVFPGLSAPRLEKPVMRPDLLDTGYLVSADDYFRHIDFQRSFSYRSLDMNSNLNYPQPAIMATLAEENYLRYYLGEDGLIEGGVSYSAVQEKEFPPFPLDKLMEFLVNYNEPVGVKYDNAIKDISKEWISAAIILAFCMLDFLRPFARGRKIKKAPVYGDKRIAA